MHKYYYQLIGIAAGWAKANLPSWTDDNHRDLLQKHGAVPINGRYSATSLNVPQLEAVLQDYERRGWSRQRRVFADAPT